MQDGGHPAAADPHPADDPRDRWSRRRRAARSAGRARTAWTPSARMPSCRSTGPRQCSGTSASSAAWSSSITRTPGWLSSRSTELGGAPGAHGAPVGFCARVVTTIARAPGAEGGGQRLGQRALVVDGHRHRAQSERGQQIEEVGPAGILDGDRVAGPQVDGEQALDRIERARGDGDRARRRPGRRRRPAAAGRRRRAPASRRPAHSRSAGRDRRRPSARSGPSGGSSARVRLAGRQVEHAGGHRQPQGRPRGGDRRPGAHAGAAAAVRLDDPAPAQLGIGLGDRGRADAADPRRARGPAEARRPNRVRPRRTPDSMLAEIAAAFDAADLILFWHSSNFVLAQIRWQAHSAGGWPVTDLYTPTPRTTATRYRARMHYEREHGVGHSGRGV